jgi:hypothetical protein
LRRPLQRPRASKYCFSISGRAPSTEEYGAEPAPRLASSSCEGFLRIHRLAIFSHRPRRGVLGRWEGICLVHPAWLSRFDVRVCLQGTSRAISSRCAIIVPVQFGKRPSEANKGNSTPRRRRENRDPGWWEVTIRYRDQNSLAERAARSGFCSVTGYVVSCRQMASSCSMVR